MYAIYIYIWLYGNIYHQYTPVLLGFITAIQPYIHKDPSWVIDRQVVETTMIFLGYHRRVEDPKGIVVTEVFTIC